MLSVATIGISRTCRLNAKVLSSPERIGIARGREHLIFVETDSRSRQVLRAGVDPCNPPQNCPSEIEFQHAAERPCQSRIQAEREDQCEDFPAYQLVAWRQRRPTLPIRLRRIGVRRVRRTNTRATAGLSSNSDTTGTVDDWSRDSSRIPFRSGVWRHQLFLAVCPIQLHRPVNRLERDGLISLEWEQNARGREMKFYRLTAAGRKQLTWEESRWRQIVRAMSRMLRPAWGSNASES